MFEEQDKSALQAGAVAYYDELIPSRNAFNGYRSLWHFARYYFNGQGQEVGYFLPDMREFRLKGLIHVHATPRHWASVPKLEPMEGGVYEKV